MDFCSLESGIWTQNPPHGLLRTRLSGQSIRRCLSSCSLPKNIQTWQSLVKPVATGWACWLQWDQTLHIRFYNQSFSLVILLMVLRSTSSVSCPHHQKHWDRRYGALVSNKSCFEVRTHCLQYDHQINHQHYHKVCWCSVLSLLVFKYVNTWYTQVMEMEAPMPDLLSKYDQNMKKKLMEVGQVRRKIDRMLQKQCF